VPSPERQNIKSGSERWAVKYLETADGSGDVIVEPPTDILAKAGLGLGDELTIEMEDGAVYSPVWRSI
jgi:antitoxin ChpS